MQLDHGGVLDLADAFAGDVEAAAHHVERFFRHALEPETVLENVAGAGIEAVHEAFHLGAQLGVVDLRKRAAGILVADDIAIFGTAFFPDGRIQRSGSEGDDLPLLDGVPGQAHGFGDVVGGRLAAQFFHEAVLDLAHAGDLVHEVRGQAVSARA